MLLRVNKEHMFVFWAHQKYVDRIGQFTIRPKVKFVGEGIPRVPVWLDSADRVPHQPLLN